jgi:nitrous oxidase accessory protein NosD
MAVLGARLLESQKKVGETAEAIELRQSGENSILGNQIAGANLVDCTGNYIYHNIFEANGMQNAADNGANQWDAGRNVGGNYWSDHEVQGNPSASPRQIPAKGVDHYPFQEPGGWR